MADILENFSKNTKRGRPPKFDPEYRAMMAALWPEDIGRSLTNRLYWMIAFKALADDKGKPLPGFDWLLSARPNGDYKRSTLIAELGRLEDADLIRQAADWLCQNKPTVQTGLQAVRNWRLLF